MYMYIHISIHICACIHRYIYIYTYIYTFLSFLPSAPFNPHRSLFPPARHRRGRFPSLLLCITLLPPRH